MKYELKQFVVKEDFFHKQGCLCNSYVEADFKVECRRGPRRLRMGSMRYQLRRKFAFFPLNEDSLTSIFPWNPKRNKH